MRAYWPEFLIANTRQTVKLFAKFILVWGSAALTLTVILVVWEDSNLPISSTISAFSLERCYHLMKTLCLLAAYSAIRLQSSQRARTSMKSSRAQFYSQIDECSLSEELQLCLTKDCNMSPKNQRQVCTYGTRLHRDDIGPEALSKMRSARLCCCKTQHQKKHF